MTAADWLDPALYPFESRVLDVDGGRMHYVDEGEGPTLLFVHGTPTWSFLFRRLMRTLSTDHRVVAMDHVGFGLSAKPRDWGYRPIDHARNLAALVDRLRLDDVTLVVHDFGGPVGLGWALDHPDRVRGLVLFNTWLWSLHGTPAETLSRIMGGAVGRFLYRRLNLSPRVLLRLAFHDRGKLDPVVHRHYLSPFAAPSDRQGPWVLARELIGSSEWYEGLWKRMDALREKPALLLWGMKDPAFGPEALERWKQALPGARSAEFPEVGHFVMEEAPEGAEREVRRFLASLPAVPARPASAVGEGGG